MSRSLESLKFRLGPCGHTIQREAVEKINKVLSRGFIRDKIDFSRRLIDLWCNGREQSETVVMFGQMLPGMGLGCMRTVTTITKRGVLRFWFGLPCHFGADHVESNGEHCLLEVTGDVEELRFVARELMTRNCIRVHPSSCTLSNGVELFLYQDV